MAATSTTRQTKKSASTASGSAVQHLFQQLPRLPAGCWLKPLPFLHRDSPYSSDCLIQDLADLKSLKGILSAAFQANSHQNFHCQTVSNTPVKKTLSSRIRHHFAAGSKELAATGLSEFLQSCMETRHCKSCRKHEGS
jgi:hypothetical protein